MPESPILTNFTENLTFDSNSTSDEISDVLKMMVCCFPIAFRISNFTIHSHQQICGIYISKAAFGTILHEIWPSKLELAIFAN